MSETRQFTPAEMQDAKTFILDRIGEQRQILNSLVGTAEGMKGTVMEGAAAQGIVNAFDNIRHRATGLFDRFTPNVELIGTAALRTDEADSASQTAIESASQR